MLIIATANLTVARTVCVKVVKKCVAIVTGAGTTVSASLATAMTVPSAVRVRGIVGSELKSQIVIFVRIVLTVRRCAMERTMPAITFG